MESLLIIIQILAQTIQTLTAEKKELAEKLREAEKQL